MRPCGEPPTRTDGGGRTWCTRPCWRPSPRPCTGTGWCACTCTPYGTWWCGSARACGCQSPTTASRVSSPSCCGRGAPAGGEALLEASGGTVPSLLRGIGPPERVGLSRAGRPVSCRRMAAGLGEGACVVVGGFQRGGFSDTTAGALDRVCSISPQPLETHLVVGRLLYDMEAALHGGRDGA